MKLPLAYYGKPILRKKAQKIEEITDEIRQLAQDMIETMHAANGIGLAGPQVNQPLRIFVTCVPIPSEQEEEEDQWEDGVERVFINPTIKDHSEESWISSEGCLSIPKVYGDVERPFKVSVEWTDLEGNQQSQEFEGLEARCIMHENDHINGVLFIDRIKGKARQALDAKLKELKKRTR